jgi:hypothetical protein
MRFRSFEVPANVNWLLSGRVIYSNYSGDVSLDDIEMASKQKMKMCRKYPDSEDFHLVVDTRDIAAYPRNISAIHAGIRSFSNARLGWIIIITKDFYLKHLGAIFARLMNTRIHSCKTLKEAYRFLQQHDDIPFPDNWSANVDDTMPQRPSAIKQAGKE